MNNVPNPVLVRDILQSRKEVPFYNQIDLLAIEKDVLIGASGNLTMGFRFEGDDLFLKSKQEIISSVDYLRKAFGHLPERTQVQFILKRKAGPGKALYDYRRAINQKDHLSREISETKFNALKRDILFNTEAYCFVTKFCHEKKKLTDKFITNNTKAIEISREEYEKKKTELQSAFSHIAGIFNHLKIEATPLNEWHYKKIFYSHLNPTRSAKFRLGKVQIDPVNNVTLRSALLFSAPVVEHEHFYQDGYFYQGINLLLPPESTDIQGLSKMLDELDIAYDFMLSFYIPNNEEEIEQLKTRANVSKTFGFMGSSKNYDATQKHAEIDSLITEIKSSTQKLVHYSLSFLIRDKHFNYLKQKQEKLLEAFPVLGSSEGLADHMNHDQLYLSYLPGHAWKNPRKYLIQSDALVNLLPFHKKWSGTEKAKSLLKSRSHELIKLDLFDSSLPAKHGLILGTTGSGKSFTTNYLLMNYLLEDPTNQLIIIDVGNSYKRLASIFKGNYYDIDLGENYAINPLIPKSLLFPDGKLDHETFAYLALVIEKLVKARNDEVLSNAQKRLIEKALLQTYKQSNAPILGDVLRTLRQHSFDEEEKVLAKAFASNLAIWAEGRYGKLLGRQGNLDIQNRFVVFELGKLDGYPDLQSIIFFIIRSAITSKLYQRNTKKVIVIDEGWRFFNDEAGSKLIEDLYRTARKFNGLVLSISQSPEDFLNTKAANAIISNSFTKYILKLNRDPQILSRFDFNDSEINAVKTLTAKPGYFSEVFVKYNQHSAVTRIEPTPLEYWLATTSPEDYKLEAQQRSLFPKASTLELLKNLAKQYPKGAHYATPRR